MIIENRTLDYYYGNVQHQVIKTDKIGRNEKCPCNSGKKFKRCCMLSKEKEINTYEYKENN